MAITFACFSNNCSCQEINSTASITTPQPEKKVKFSGPVFIEAGIVLNALIASLNPKVFGAFGMLLSPAFVVDTKDLIIAEPLFAYHVYLGQEERSQVEIFRQSLIAWNLAWGASLFFEDEKKTSTMYIFPTQNGVSLQMAWAY